MAENKTKTAGFTIDAPDPGEELVDYTAPMIYGLSDRDIFVAVNGENIRIKRGVAVKIKRKFLEVLENAARQEQAAHAFMDEARKSSQKAIAEM